MSAQLRRVDRKVALRWALGGLSLFYVVTRFLPGAPQQHHSMDDSYMLVLHEAFRHQWQFGREIVFPFGPWGFLCAGFQPATAFVSITIWTALAVVFWWSGWRIARRFFEHEIVAWLWFMLFIALATVSIFLNMDVRLAAFAVLLLLLHFFVETEWWSVRQAALTVALGLLSLTKFSEFVLTTLVVLTMAANTVGQGRRFPWVLPVFGASALSFWLLAGQKLSSFIPFLAGSWRISSGYTAAMMLTGSNELWDVVCFAAGAVLLCAAIAYAAWARHRFYGIFPLCGFCFILFAAFKYGYVRHDGHEVTAVSQLLLITWVCFPLLWPLVRKDGAGATIGSFLPVIAIYVFAAITFARHSETGLSATLAKPLAGREILAPLDAFWGQQHLRQAYEKFLDDFRRDTPLPPIKGSVDAYPWNQATLLAHGLEYRPRPTIQSCNAYTRELAELNAAFLRSDRAPENIFFEVWTIDDRFPSLDDGLSWPELLSRYDVVERAGNFLRLHRRALSRPYEMIPLGESAVALGTALQVPSANAGPIWAEIEFDPTWIGKIASFFYKPPVLKMAVTLKDGRSRPFRIIPAMTRGGFLLSPVPESTKSFALLGLSNSTAALAEWEVASINFSAETKSGTTPCYASPVRVRFYRLALAAGAGR